ncbi:DUF3369 domain-containing protein [Psychromonas sp. MME2]|uniref:DUF3369 domain-containing protein n=1 Tax=unclassified Psychromonas TaxID=2614957 RepID=UPI00339CA741
MDWLAEDIVGKDDNNLPPWKIAIVDDNVEVHKVTELILNNFQFEDRKLSFINLYSGAEAKQCLAAHDDIAMVFLDVVMESDEAGLEVVKYIRNDLHNHYSRIILRTGQPGMAPEHKVVRDYDIDGYKEKTELTTHALQHTVYTALRSYRDLVRIQNYKKGLEALIDSINNMTQIDDVLGLSSTVLNQIKNVLNAQNTHFLIKSTEALTITQSNQYSFNISIEETMASFIDENRLTESKSPLSTIAQSAFKNKNTVIEHPYYCHYFQSQRGSETVFIIKCLDYLSESSLRLIKLFSINSILTIENLLLRQNNKDTGSPSNLLHMI